MSVGKAETTLAIARAVGLSREAKIPHTNFSPPAAGEVMQTLHAFSDEIAVAC